MGLSGIQIFKFLPAGQKIENANCKKCGCVTCMAYAMKLAKNEVSIDLCPYIEDSFKQTLLKENKKPQAAISFGKNNTVVIGDENVMFRHDKTFVNPCCFSVAIDSDDKNFDAKLRNLKNFFITQVGNDYSIDAIALKNSGQSFEMRAKEVLASGIATIIITDNIKSLTPLIELIKFYKPLCYLTSQNLDEITELSKICPVVVAGESEIEISTKMSVLLKNGTKNIVINLLQDVNYDIVEPLTQIRRNAIEKKLDVWGFPVMISCNLTENIALDTIKLSSLVCKYANLIVINELNCALLTSLITLRNNIYTDPQKPLQVEPKLYEIGDVTPDSKVIVTTNFALTYFAVANELESLNEGTYLLITDAGGMSVLTAWAASKFTCDTIANAIKTTKLEEKINHKTIIIPGLVGDLKDELQEELPDFEILIGTSEASELPEFLSNI